MANGINDCDPQDLSCITIENAGKLLDQNEVIRHASSVFIIESIRARRNKFDELERDNPNKASFKKIFNKTLNRFSLNSNIYIFSFAEIQKLVEDTGSTHIMVIDGSQQEDEDSKFQIGQSTIIIVPCVDTGTSNNQGEIFRSQGRLAREHPQFRYERRIPLANETNLIEVYKA